MLVLISALSPARTKRGGGQGEGAVGVGQGEANGGGVRVRDGTRQMGKDCNDTLVVQHVSDRSFSKSYPIERLGASNFLLYKMSKTSIQRYCRDCQLTGKSKTTCTGTL
jgi:hypothetical protein